MSQAGLSSRRWMVDLCGGLACAALTAAAYWVLVAPWLESRASRVREQADLQDRQKTVADQAATLAELKARLQAVQQAVASSHVQLLPAESINQRIARLTELAADRKLILQELRIGQAQADARHKTFPIAVSGLGSYAGCMDFFRRINQDFADIQIDAMVMSATPDRPLERRFVCQLVWFALP